MSERERAVRLCEKGRGRVREEDQEIESKRESQLGERK